MATAQNLVDRYLRLWESLPLSGDGVKRAMLETWASHQGISYRQVQRDLLFLEEAGHVRSLFYGNGKRWFRTSLRPRLQSISREQAFVLSLVEAKLRHLLPSQYLQALYSQWDEAAARIGKPDCKTERAWFEKIQVLPEILAAPRILDGIFPVIVDALLEEKWLQIEYENYEHQEKSARVMPLGIVEYEQLYYLVCRSQGYEDVRHIRVDRVIHAHNENEAFRYPQGFSLAQHIASGAFEFDGNEPIQLRMYMFNGTHQHLIDRPLSQDQQIDEADHDGRVVVQATVPNSHRLYWWILGLGASAEVIEPASLRLALQKEIGAMRRRYESG